MAREKAISEGVIDPESAPNAHMPFQKDTWGAVAKDYTAGKQTKGARIIGFGEGGAAILNLPMSRKRVSYICSNAPSSSGVDPEKEALQTQLSQNVER